jgi:diguanylate cyclase (GGDEF)-like protein
MTKKNKAGGLAVRSSGNGVMLIGVILVAAMLAVVGWAIVDRRYSAVEEYTRTTTRLAVAVEEQTARSLQAVDLVLQDVQRQIASAHQVSAERLQTLTGDPAFHEFLVGRLSNLPQMAAVTLVGPSGQMLNSSREKSTLGPNLFNRDFFHYFVDHDDQSVFLSNPVNSMIDGVWTVYLARRLDGPGGVFMGVVVAPVRLQYFQDFYRAVSHGDGESVAMLRRDGTLLTEYTGSPHNAMTNRASDPQWIDAVRKGGGVFDTAGIDRGSTRFVAVNPLPLFPIVIEVSIIQRDALAQWRAQTFIILALAMATALCVLFLIYVLAQQVHRAALSKMALQRSQDRLAEKSALLEATLKNMGQGLLMLDADRRILVNNSRAADVLGLPPGFLENRPHYFDVLARRWDHAKGGSRTDEEVTEMLRRGGDLDRVHVSERLLPNGRVVEARNVPFEGGRVVRTYTDITERRNAENRIKHIAQHDELTGLLNRAAFQEGLRHAVDGAGGVVSSFALLCLDLDRFKLVNDTRGHQFGDRLLAEAGQRMRAVTQDGDLVARMGGDEFAIIQQLAGQAEAAQLLAQRLVEAVSQPYVIDGQQSIIGVSIGIALYSQHGDKPDQLMRSADTALYRAKESGRNTHCSFEPAMDMRYQERSLIEHDLRGAIAAGQFEMVYQPVYDIVTGELTTFEALLRWNHPTRGQIPPGHFIPVAEMSGLIVPIGRWALETACAEAAIWNDQAPRAQTPLRIAVNLSPVQFREPDLPDIIADILRRTKISGAQLDLEVTEGLLLDDGHQVLQTIEALKRQGIRITLDDFGSAYASLSYLCRFPFERIKLDRSFVSKIVEDPQAEAVVEAILILSRKLHVEVVAEGVETMAQLDILRRLHCRQVQGFLTGRPMASAAVRAMLAGGMGQLALDDRVHTDAGRITALSSKVT